MKKLIFWSSLLNYFVLPGSGNIIMGRKGLGAFQTAISLWLLILMIFLSKKLMLITLSIDPLHPENIPIELFHLTGYLLLCMAILLVHFGWVIQTHYKALKAFKQNHLTKNGEQ